MASNSSPVMVLVVDPDRATALAIADRLREAGFEAEFACAEVDALARVDRGDVDVILIDLDDGRLRNCALWSHALRGPAGVVVTASRESVAAAHEAVRAGAQSYVVRPFGLDEAAPVLRRAAELALARREAASLREQLRGRLSPFGMVGASKPMRRVFENVLRAAAALDPVLITGEAGTGKSLIAGAIHAHSSRAGGPFETVHAGDLSGRTHAHASQHSSFVDARIAAAAQSAGGGTLFIRGLDEVSPLDRSEILDATDRIALVGGRRGASEFDVRVIAAARAVDRTSLACSMEAHGCGPCFVTIDVPPLRERADDVAGLTKQLLAAARARHRRSPARRFSASALDCLMEHPWPGNVRELALAIDSVVMVAAAPIIGAEDLPASIRQYVALDRLAVPRDVLPMREMQRRYAAWAFDQTERNRSRTAARLDIDYKTLAKLLDERGA